MLQVKLVKSPIGNTKRNRATVAALGLRKMHQTVVLPDNESVRGMIFKVKHMLAVKVVEGDAAGHSPSKPTRRRTGGAVVEATPVTKPKTEKPKAEKPKAEAAEQAEKPKAETKTKSESKAPEGDAEQTDAKPKAEVKPKAEAKSKAEPKAKTGAKPKPAAKKKEQK